MKIFRKSLNSPTSKSKPTALGRLPAGSKGLGRLAALRMGQGIELTTRPANEPDYEYWLKIDWREFDKASVVESVELNIEKRKRIDGQPDGTSLEIIDLKTAISSYDVKRLARALILLSDPFGNDPTGFKPILNVPEYSEIESLVANRYFDDADYHLIATLDKEGRASAKVLDWKGGMLYSASHDEISMSRAAENSDKEGEYRYKAPEASYDLWNFIMSKPSFQSKPVSIGEVRTWLKTFGGVHLYENNKNIINQMDFE